MKVHLQQVGDIERNVWRERVNKKTVTRSDSVMFTMLTPVSISVSPDLR